MNRIETKDSDSYNSKIGFAAAYGGSLYSNNEMSDAKVHSASTKIFQKLSSGIKQVGKVLTNAVHVLVSSITSVFQAWYDKCNPSPQDKTTTNNSLLSRLVKDSEKKGLKTSALAIKTFEDALMLYSVPLEIAIQLSEIFGKTLQETLDNPNANQLAPLDPKKLESLINDFEDTFKNKISQGNGDGWKTFPREREDKQRNEIFSFPAFREVLKGLFLSPTIEQS